MANPPSKKKGSLLLSRIEVYANDTLNVVSTTYAKEVPVFTWYEDQTEDGVRFTIRRNSYVMYIPWENTVFKVNAKARHSSVSDHFVYVLTEVRKHKKRKKH